MELQFDTSKVYAIALEGGGAKGAYEAGVWKALEEAGVKYNAVAGTSVGALNGAMMASRDLETALHLWDIRHRNNYPIIPFTSWSVSKTICIRILHRITNNIVFVNIEGPKISSTSL